MNNLGQVLRHAREGLGHNLEKEVSEGDIAAEIRRHGLPMERKTWSNLETGRTKTLKPKLANELPKLLPVTCRALVAAMGYELEYDGEEAEAASALLEGFLASSDADRRIAQLALGLDPEQTDDPRLRSLRRLAARGRQDHQETLE